MFGLRRAERNLKFFFLHTVQKIYRELENSGSKPIKYKKKLEVCKSSFAQDKSGHSLSSILHLRNKLNENQRAGQVFVLWTEKIWNSLELESFLISINQSQMSAVFYLQSSPEKSVGALVGNTLRDFWEPGAAPPPSSRIFSSPNLCANICLMAYVRLMRGLVPG